MKHIILNLIFVIVLISCKANDSNNKIHSKVIDDSITSNKIDKDSVKIIGDNILNGERIWGENEKYIFALMDSFTNSQPDTRLFYFKVFGKMCEQADGYVGEAIGLYVLKYFELNPIEFIKNSKVISDSTLKSMGYNAGLEISMTNDGEPQEIFTKLKAQTIQKTKQLSNSERQKLEIFFQQMNVGLDSNKD